MQTLAVARSHAGLALSYDPRLRIEGTGAPLVYVPGMDGTGQLFFRQVPRLLRHHRVVTYRLDDAATHLDELGDDLAAVIDHVSPSGEPATLVAESFGGALAMTFALRHPERVRALVVLNSFAWLERAWRLRLAAEATRRLPWSVTRTVRSLAARRHFSPGTPREDIREATRRVARGATLQGYVNRLDMLARYDLREQLGDIDVPSLFLAADRDAMVPAVRQARFMASRVPDATLHILEGHGHASLLAPGVHLDALLDDWERLG